MAVAMAMTVTMVVMHLTTALVRMVRLMAMVLLLMVLLMPPTAPPMVRTVRLLRLPLPLHLPSKTTQVQPDGKGGSHEPPFFYSGSAATFSR